MPEKISPGSVMPEAPVPALPTRSLRASARSTNPQARMQELLREGTAPARRDHSETSGEGNNEVSFIVSEGPIKEVGKEVLSEHIEETSTEPPQVVREEPAKQAMKQGGKTAPAKASPKQSLKDTVLDEGRAVEERVSKTRLNVDIDEDLHFWLKGHAIQNRRKLNDLIPRILKAYRDEVEGE